MATDRGYPIFPGQSRPAGPNQMQQLAEAIDADIEAHIGADALGLTFGANWGPWGAEATYYQGVTQRDGNQIFANGLVRCLLIPSASANFLIGTVHPDHWPTRTLHADISVQSSGPNVVDRAASVRVSHTNGKMEIIQSVGLIAGMWMDLGMLRWPGKKLIA